MAFLECYISNFLTMASHQKVPAQIFAFTFGGTLHKCHCCLAGYVASIKCASNVAGS
jgi:hypothetical protein